MEDLDIDEKTVQNKGIRIYKTIILPVVLHGCETWSLTLTHWRPV
jgi:hypothetical protein